MKTTKFLSVLILCLFLAAQSSSLKILSVSGLPGSVSNPAFSSLRGGAMIYLKVIGHDLSPTGSRIYVGTFPCIIPSDGVSDTFIACQTTDCGSQTDINNLPVTIISQGTSYTTTGYPNSVYYRDYNTPYLKEVFPSSGFAYSSVNYYGIHRIKDLGDGLRTMGDVTKLLLGNQLCSRFDVDQAGISRDGNEYIRCIQSHQQEAGKYNVSEQVVPGYAKHYPFLRRSSLIPAEYFEFASLPTVTAVTPNFGNNGGQNLVITGTGFSLNQQNNSVLIDGNPCAVTFSDEGTIKCTVAPKNPALSTKLTSNSTNQTNPYFAGAGLNYARYSFSGGLATLTTAVRSNNATALGSAQQKGFRAQLREGNYYGKYYGQTWNGYFTAPVTGVYTFTGTSDDVFSLYLATTPGSTELPTLPFISSDAHQYWDDFYINYHSTAQATVSLVQGKSYYLQAYHINWAGTGNFRIDVQVPNNDTSLTFQTYQIDEIYLSSTIQPQILVYKMSGATNGTFNLRILRPNDYPVYDVDTDVTYGCSAADFATALNKFDIFSPYAISVTRVIYNGSSVLTDITGATQITYTVSVFLSRPSNVASQKFLYTAITYNGGFTQPSVAQTAHSPTITGTFTLSIGGVTIDPNNNGTIYYDANPGDIQNWIQAHIVGFENVEVTKGYQYSCDYACSWYIKYKSRNTQQTNVVANAAALSGGVGQPTITINNKRAYSPNVLFSPIDYRFLNLPSSTPNVLVSTNGVPSVCTGTCSYAFSLYSEVFWVSRSGSVLSFGITDPQSIGFTASQIKVTVQGQPCANPTGTLANLTCQLLTNGDGSLALVAGTNIIPKVWVGNYGLAALTSNATGISIPLVVNPLNVSSGGTNGGYVITVTGNGFPSSKSDISITLCNATATIKSVSSTQAAFYVPSCSSNGSRVLTVKVGQSSDSSQSFSYVDPTGAPTVISITPTSANPGSKGTLEINGNNFGTDTSVLQVFLSNSSGKVYQLSVLTLTNTYIKVGLSGGLAGTFTVQINLQGGAGDSIPATAGADQFQYVVSISSISPNQGSIYGGSLLTITGQNFNTAAQQTLAFIGDTINWFCTIESITATAIQCRTPAISEDYSPGTAQNVVVTTRLIVVSTCLGNCTFTYLDVDHSPNVTSLTVNASVVNLVGTSFTAGSSCSVSLTNSVTGVVTVVAATSCSTTAASFVIVSSINSGSYNVRIRSELGESNSWPLKVYWSAGSQDISGGSIAGTLVKFTGGSGYPADLTDRQFSVVIMNNNVATPANVISCCSGNSITILIPPAAEGTYLTIYFYGPANSGKVGDYTVYASSTGNIALTSSASVSPGLNTITLSITKVITNPIVSINLISTISPSYIINVANWTLNGTVITFQASLTSGSFRFQIRGASRYYLITDVINAGMPTNIYTNPQSYSYNGGIFKVQAIGLSPFSNIRVNGLKGKLISYDHNTSIVTYEVPPLLTTLTQTTYKLATANLIDLSSATFFSDTNNNTNAGTAFDGSTSTIYGSANGTCWVGIDFGTSLMASVSRIRFFPNIAWVNTADKILNSKFEGTNDLSSSWTTLATTDQTVHSGWNILVSASSTAFRYVRYSHTSASQCNLAEIQLYGLVYSAVTISDLTSQPSDIIYEDGLNTATFAGNATYASANTAIVTSFSPKYGDVFGGYPLTIYGTNLNFDIPSVVIDGITCANATAVNSTAITCVVGARPSLPTANSIVVMVGASKAILRDTFYYVLKWSDKRTWGTDLPPIDGDLISVPQGMSLLVDQDTPQVKGIAVDHGAIIFSDEKDITVRAGFITLNGGKFIAGTEQAPHQHKLNFIMYGDYYDIQQPMFGNKGIGCMQCSFSMYGRPRTPTWTTLASPIAPGATTLTLSQDIDWQIGEEIVVASTSFYHWQAERRTITGVTGRTLTVNASFTFAHAAVVETYGSGDKLPMIAEVGLLTRNIKMRGDDESSMLRRYGSHLMIAGQATDGTEGHIAYTEFTQCGQPAILGRYCIHFHMNGDVPTSYVRGNAVHDSLARVVTLHAVHYLTVEHNVGYRVRGHNFFVEDGIETHNTIRYNLAIGSIAVTNMMQTDTSVASFWVTNPSNDFYGNHAAGSDFYGIWYEIKPNPDGPSATSDVCPIGNPLGSVHDNVAHSNVRFGFRIFKLSSRLYPCQEIRDDRNGTNPWFSNPSSTSLFTNFVLYKNLEDGLLAEQTGNAVFQNFTIAENYHSGVQFYLSNFTQQPPKVIDSFIVGKSQTNAASDPTNYTLGMSGAITSRSGVTQLTNIRFYNFPQGSILFQTCRLCDDPLKYTNLGTQVILSQITLTDVTGRLLFMIGLKRDVIYDLDGSLSQAFDGTSRSSATIVHGFPHIAAYNNNTCPFARNSTGWDGAVMCGPTASLRRVVFTNLQKHQDFAAQHMKAAELSSVTSVLPLSMNETLFTSIQCTLPNNNMQPKVEKPHSWGLPFITGKIYNIWWSSGIDFTHLSVFTSPSFLASEKGIIFKFNYSENRELYKIGSMVGGIPPVQPFFNKSATFLDANTCNNGEYFHNNSDDTSLKMFTLCQSGKNRAPFEYTQVNGIVCQFVCPTPPGTFVLEDFVRIWSNATQWPGGKVPKAGDNVTVEGTWRLLLDVNPPPLNNLTIDGNLIADDTRDVTLIANFIFIRAGNFSAGSPTDPFIHKLTIQINGQKTDTARTIDPFLTGNKFFVVTGFLNLYGNPPSTVIATLTQTAFANSSVINVDDSTGWAVGDTISLAPSFSKFSEYELATIKSLNTDGSITLNSPLQYIHYGDASVTVSSVHGNLDTRAKVGHINRNIQIVSGPDSGWGFSIYVYGYTDTASRRRVGTANLVGVQIQDGGQLDSGNSPLVFKNLIGGNYTSTVKSSSFVNCRAYCISVDTANNITITNNVLYNAWVFAVQIVSMKSFTFTNNIIIGVTGRPSIDASMQLVACFSSLFYVDALNDKVKVTDNFCQGSQKHGWAVAHTTCDQLQINPFANNTIGSADIGFILNNINQQCNGFSYAKAYACNIGHIQGPPSSKATILSNFILADNGRGASLKIGASEGKNNHTAYLRNSYITPVSRPNCAFCYGSTATSCTQNIGVRMFTASANGQIMPAKFGHGFDVICKQPVFNSKAYLTNVIFDNFKQSYNGTNVNSICSNNFVFRPHTGAFDMVGGHYLTGCQCTRCDTNSYVLSDSPDPSMLGWFGGCGDILCTGKNNYQITDWTGGFLGSLATIIGNNSVIGNNQPNCKYSSSMNAHICNGTDIATLEYQSIAPDFNTRIMWPVNLTYDGSNYTTFTNGWREWEWLGKEPQNKRFGRFVSVVSLFKTYNMTFGAIPPFNLQLQLQTRTPAGNNSNFIIVKLHYPLPNSIKITVNNVVIKPVVLTDANSGNTTALLNSLDRTKCGSNIYFYTNSTIQFVLTEAPDCTAVVSLVDSISLTTHFAMDINQFFANNSTLTNFINNLCALLQISDTSRVKVVGVFAGSVILNAVVEAASTNTATTVSSATPQSDPNSLASAASLLAVGISNGAFQASMAANVGTVQTVTSTTNYLSTQDNKQEDKNNNVPLIVGVSIGGAVLVVFVTLGVMWMVRKRAKVMEDMVSEESFPQENEEKNPDIFGKANIHPEQSNIMLRSNPKTTIDVKDVEE